MIENMTWYIIIIGLAVFIAYLIYIHVKILYGLIKYYRGEEVDVATKLLWVIIIIDVALGSILYLFLKNNNLVNVIIILAVAFGTYEYLTYEKKVRQTVLIDERGKVINRVSALTLLKIELAIITLALLYLKTLFAIIPAAILFGLIAYEKRCDERQKTILLNISRNVFLVEIFGLLLFSLYCMFKYYETGIEKYGLYSTGAFFAFIILAVAYAGIKRVYERVT